MPNLNKDILFLIFEELQNDPKSLFSCLMVNRLWCETAVPILWRYPWSYSDINYGNKKERIRSPSIIVKPIMFDYLSFCRSINISTINNIISIGSKSNYYKFIIQQEFYCFFMKKCRDLKYLDMRSIEHQIFYFPENKNCLDLLCELKCDTSIDSSYFYGISQFCQRIQKLVVINTDYSPNPGIVKLIEVQKNLKHFEWIDDFLNSFITEHLYKDSFFALEKKAESLNYLRIYFYYVEDNDQPLFLEVLLKLYKLKTLIIGENLFLSKEQLKTLKKQVYPELEILNIEYNEINVASSLIENSGGLIKKILLKPHDIIDFELQNDNFNESSLNFIRKVYKNCPLIEYLSILISPTKENFIELEKLLKRCQNLKSLLIVIFDNDEDTYEENLEYGDELLNILIRSAPPNFNEIRFSNEFEFSLDILEEFLENWRGRSALSLFTIDPIYESGNYLKLINKYKNDKVIKDFECVRNRFNYRIDDHIN
ncbi:hypothetical protein RirG_016160 [Rhizophagus irregularis DAOM 197198w]|uniref:F-box domain-containing protein n=1 Tax=Rhizophagus irregularis (strain DAOM 197198w) TaxID=1432141 RepID=A0A015K976_RHIIW|nr:hypothetical protein RirG_016160 [Rhizophagus irregularis DAOM 197198w]